MKQTIKSFVEDLRALPSPEDMQGVIRFTPIGGMITVINAVIYTIAVWPIIGGGFLLGWAIFTIGLNVMILARAHGRPPGRPRKVSRNTLRRIRRFAVLQAAPWAGMGMVMEFHAIAGARELALFVCVGMAAGASFMLHRVLSAAMVYLGTVLVGLLIGAVAGRDPYAWAVASYALVYCGFLGQFTYRFGRMARERDKVVDDLSHAVLELETAHDRISQLAYTDTVTGLPNRKAFFERLSREIDEGRRFAVLMLDLDRFKNVNDSYGHDAGDQLLAEVACRLRGRVPERDMVARLGGDEFAVLSLQEGEALDALGARICAALAEPVLLEDIELHTGTSVGAALRPEDGDDPVSLMSKADIALGRVKETGRGRFQRFDAGLGKALDESNVIADALRAALGAGDVKVRYQPKIRLADGALSGVEALVRWTHPLLGPMSPDRFLPVAAERGMMREVTDGVLGTVLRDLAEWRSLGIATGPVAINLHPVDLKSPDALLTRLRRAREAGLSPADLIIEITEGCFVGRGGDSARLVLDSLTDLGFELSLDDFGTGHAALSHLRSLPVSEIKIDRSFVSGIVEEPHDRAIVAATLAIARGMRLRAVAEGIETEAQLEVLRELGAELGQGYYWARPLSSSELRAFAENRAAA
ncbi:putative bifunctional diguanylate cyclase/phosphodiesterase [Rhodovulum sp. DZ06]|uniref:putative bifunctional diguanylate cyclase/phosphodiesterase n=1 Tax=Rhodovulum sp. DZ06 TaxID=3425126 RepID=UPI003D33D340